MKEYNYHFYAYVGAVLTLAIILVVGLFSVLQPMRMFRSAKEMEVEAIHRGEEVFGRDCAACHGGHGEGVRGIAPPLNTQEFLKEASDELMFNTITDGRPGTSMPASVSRGASS
jgi:mono/diheme cytochrome c family protein